jgi:hypothetical protein
MKSARRLNRHGVHEPLRLSGPRIVLDRLQGYRAWRGAVAFGLLFGHAAEILSHEKGDEMSVPSRNWSYPTAIKFGVGRVTELAEHCKTAGITRPLLVTDRALASLPITAKALDVLDAGGLGRAVFSQVDPNPNEGNMAAGIAAYLAGGHDGVVCFRRRVGA